MRIIRDQSVLTILGGVRSSESGLLRAMSRASTGQRVQSPGDAPTEFGISEMLRYQIRNSNEAIGTIQNATNLIGTSDAWLQQTQDILGRMQELAVASADGSKSQQDRRVLNNEFLQLKEEISRIAHDAKYNGIPVAGRDQMLAYDADKQTFQFSFVDGTDSYSLDRVFISGVNSRNGIDLQFDATKPYMLSRDGLNIFYVDSADQLTRYEIETGVVTRDTSDTTDKGLDIDETGRLWYTSETAPGSGIYQLREQNGTSWVQDSGTIADGDIADIATKNIQVYQDRAFYVDTAGNYVSRSLVNYNDVRIELDSNEVSFSTTSGQFAISEDGLFIADVPTAGTIRVINTATGKDSSFAVGSTVNISSLQFGVDNQDIAFVDTADGSIHRVGLTAGDAPHISGDSRVALPTGANGFAGLSIGGGSHRSNFRVQNGPNAAQASFVTGGDVRLYTLGLSRTSVDTISNANDALTFLSRATDEISIQRARMGAEESRLDFSREALTKYVDNLTESDSFLRDADVAAETATIAKEQVRYQASLSLLSQANTMPQALLRLLGAA